MFCFIIKITDINLAMRIDNSTIECQLTDLFVYITYFAEIFKMLLCKVVDVNLSRDSKISWSYWGIPPPMVDNSAAEVKLVMLILWSLGLYGRVINDCDDPAANPPLHRSVQVWLFLTWWLFFTCKHACLNYQV